MTADRVEVRIDVEAASARGQPNGAAVAAVLASGIGAFAMGFFVIINELGIFTAPSLHGGAGGVSGRTTFAAVAWLVAWGVLHSLWKDRELDAAKLFRTSLLLVALSLVLTFPPVWGLLGG